MQDPAWIRSVLARLDAGHRVGTRTHYAGPEARGTARGLLQILERTSIDPVKVTAQPLADGSVRLGISLKRRTVLMLVTGRDEVRCRLDDGQHQWTDSFGAESNRGHIHIRNVLAWVEAMPSWDEQYPGKSSAAIADEEWEKGF